MGNMRNSAAACKLTDEFNHRVDQNEQWSLDWNDSPDVDHVTGKDYCIGKKNRIDRTTGTYQQDIHSKEPVDRHAEKTVKDSAHKIEKKEFLCTYSLLKRYSEKKQGYHVEKDMTPSTMDKKICHRLPEVMKSKPRKGKPKVKGRTRYHLNEEKCCNIDENNCHGGIHKYIAERFFQ